MKIKTVRDRVWNKFSKYIRLKYADKNGYCRCVTCKVRKHWKEMHAGHYKHGYWPGTWTHEKNVHPQCNSCNTFKGGMLDKYALFLEETYGEGVLQELDKLKHQSSATWTIRTLLEREKEIENLCVLLRI